MLAIYAYRRIALGRNAHGSGAEPAARHGSRGCCRRLDRRRTRGELHRTGGAGHLVASGVNEGIRAGWPVDRLRRDGCGIAATHLLADHVAGQEREERKSARSMLLSGLRAFFRPELGLAFFLRPIGWRYLFVHRDGSLIVAFALLGRVGLARHTLVNRIVDGRI